MSEDYLEHERVATALVDPILRADYAAPFTHYRPGLIARVLGYILVTSGTLVYGKKPSYAKFKAVEIIARVPYQSWEVATYTLLTLFYTDERRAIKYAKTSAFSRMAQDNETMHVVVISQIVRKLRCTGFIRHTLIPFLFAFFYFWAVYVIYLFSRKTALELNYLFECHAYAQYQEFLEREGDRLASTPIMSEFLTFYGRSPRTEYEFFEMVRNDELIHRNRSLRELQEF